MGIKKLILYQLTNLIRFYCGTINQAIPKSSELISMLEDLDQLAYTQFLSVLQASVQHQTSSRMAIGNNHLYPKKVGPVVSKYIFF